MAKITTITNPLTGQPAQVDQLDHTAQQIDDGISRALPGGAIDIALQNKAPAGYGEGSINGISVQASDDLNDMVRNGTYQWANILPKNAPSEYCKMRVWNGAGWISQEVMSAYSSEKDSERRRVYNSGEWGPWEWVNPPMELGKEYRTTERYMGKPVYRKLIWGGPLPNSGYTQASIASGCIIIQAVCHKTSAASASEVTPSTIGDVIPWNNNEGDGINMNAFNNNVNLWCKINRSSSNFVAYLWYIKDTD